MAIIGMLIHISVDFNLQPMANALTFILVLFIANATATLPAIGTSTAQIKATERPQRKGKVVND
ncbi:hypothetical protein OPW39_25210 [Vibrio europaeus]|nr:hypothetical protein [Vibrio europaeus]MDC5872105.1 hypothetical protein [Vibrio europaeus]